MLYEEYVWQERRIEELEELLFDYAEGLVLDTVERVGQEIARELGFSQPGSWRMENNRILELLYELQKEVEIECNRISLALRS
jgi:hypothetical protein